LTGIARSLSFPLLDEKFIEPMRGPIMFRALGMTAILVSLALVAPGDAQQRPAFGSVGARDLQFKVIDIKPLSSSIDTSKFFRQPKQSSPFSLTKFFPKFSLPMLPQKQVSAPIARPEQNPLRPPKAPLVFNPATLR
jgi:hypothetical protein